MACDPTRLAYWADHYQRWQTSGLSQRTYCEREGVSYSSFDHWRRQARGAVGVVADATTPTDKLTLAAQTNRKATVGTKWISAKTPQHTD